MLFSFNSSLNTWAAISMAARRILPFVLRKRVQNSLRSGPSCQLRPANIFFSRLFSTTGLPTISEDSENHEENPKLKPLPNLSKILSHENSDKTSAFSNLEVSPRHDLAMIFTCKVCETRSFKPVCRESYEKGVVVARCDGCNNLHLIADRLGWFGEPGSVEDFLAARGEEVKKGSLDTLNLTLEDFSGRKP